MSTEKKVPVIIKDRNHQNLDPKDAKKLIDEKIKKELSFESMIRFLECQIKDGKLWIYKKEFDLLKDKLGHLGYTVTLDSQ